MLPKPKQDDITKSKSFGAFSADSMKRLPVKVHCPVCSEVVLQLELTPNELAGAIASGSLAAKKISCVCGVSGVFALRKTRAGMYLYSMTFWIMPKAAEKTTMSNQELMNWLKRPLQPPPA